MNKNKKEFEFKLSAPLTFQCVSGLITTEKLLFKAPSNNHSDKLDLLRQKLVSSIMKNSLNAVSASDNKNKKVINDDDTQLDGAAILFILYGTDFDLEAFKDIFWSMILDKLCFLDDTVTLNKSLFNDISLDDATDIMGEYTANFIVPSWMKRQMQGAHI